MKITAILPVSRIQYLDRVLDSLKAQTHQPDNLLVVYDGYETQFLEVRNRIVELKYDNVLCVPSINLSPAHSIPDRRRHIVNIHNQMREIIENCDYVFSIEDDGVLPPDALEKLVKDMQKHPDAGLITGVELGRWGIPYVGAWTVDSITEPRKIKSLYNKTYSDEVDEIDACGLYCALIDADLYKSHEFFTANGLGPDVNLALYIRKQGMKNYIDWSIHVTHLTFTNGQDIEIPATSNSKEIVLNLLSGSTWGH